MTMVEKFEDLIAWQKARVLTRRIYETTGGKAFREDLSLRRQLRRAAVSVMSNIAEGFERGSRTEFHRFLSIAKSSCAELRSALYVCLDVGFISQTTFDTVAREAQEVGRIIGGLRKSVGKNREKPRTR
jgi:four helix bundle protein